MREGVRVTQGNGVCVMGCEVGTGDRVGNEVRSKCDCIKDGPQNPPSGPLYTGEGGVFRSGRAKHAPIYPTLKAYGTSGPTIGAAAVVSCWPRQKANRTKQKTVYMYVAIGAYV